MTFSIVAGDPERREWGVAVASRFLATGALAPFAEAGAGALATQALANTGYGAAGLSLLRDGRGADETLAELVSADAGRADRQLGVVDATGGAATYTGDACLHWAGGRTGHGYAAQGNVLTGPEVVDAMAGAFESAGPGPLARRLQAALVAGDAAGGDRRGRQSAALLVVSPGGGYGGYTDRAVDLRVDDHPDPVAELDRLLGIHELLYGSTPEEEHVSIDEIGDELRELLERLGYHAATGDPEAVREALRAWVGAENLEERWWGADRVDPVIVERLRELAGALPGGV